MNYQSFEYYLNAIYYCIWLKNVKFAIIVNKSCNFLLLSIIRLFLSKKYYKKFKNHIAKNIDKSYKSFYDERDGLCINVTKFDADIISAIYSSIITVPLCLSIFIYINYNIWISIPLIIVFLYIFNMPLSKHVYKNDKYLEYFKYFKKENKQWLRKWIITTLFIFLGSLLSLGLSIYFVFLIIFSS